MKVEKRPWGSYRVRKTYKGKTYSLSFDEKPTERDVMLRLTSMIEEKVSRDSFDYCANKYVESRTNVLSPSSIRTYYNLIKVISKDFKTKKLYSITQEDIQNEINRYAVDHAPKSVRSLHGFIAAVFGSYRPSFTLSTTLPQKGLKRPYRPNKDDIQRILDYEKGTKYYIPFKLGALGLRRGEICSLSETDIKNKSLYVNKTKVYDGKKWIIKPTPKTDESNRVIPLSNELLKEIKQYGIEFNGSPKLLNTELHRAQRALGIPEFRFHDMRHFFASFASLHAPEQDVMKLGGWKSDFVFKRIYRESMDESIKESAKTIIDNIF